MTKTEEKIKKSTRLGRGDAGVWITEVKSGPSRKLPSPLKSVSDTSLIQNMQLYFLSLSSVNSTTKVKSRRTGIPVYFLACCVPSTWNRTWVHSRHSVNTWISKHMKKGLKCPFYLVVQCLLWY